MSGAFDFPWEREAMRGCEMPEGLSLPDQLAYTALRNVYHAYYNKVITRDAASAEKGRIKYRYDLAVRNMNFEKELCAYHVRVIKDTEAAKSAFRKNPSVQAAMKLCNVMDGLRPPPLDGI